MKQCLEGESKVLGGDTVKPKTLFLKIFLKYFSA